MDKRDFGNNKRYSTKKLSKEAINKQSKFFGKWSRTIVYGIPGSMRKYTLLVILLFGLAGILVDLDHFLVVQIQLSRPLHIPYFIGFWIVGICYFTHVYRCLHKSSMKEVKYEKSRSKKAIVEIDIEER